MGKFRAPGKKSKYYMPKEDYLTAVHWCLRYPSWVEELSIEPDSSKAITYDKDRVQTSPSQDNLEKIAIRRVELQQKRDLLEETVRFVVSKGMTKYMILAVGYGLTFWQLKDQGMPCGEWYYKEKRQQIYYEISKKI